MKVWVKTAEFAEGKFLVIRRDGTTPDWPHFVMGARDPAVPAALMRYADEARAWFFDDEYIESVAQLAGDFIDYRQKHGDGDPPAAPHRKDLPLAIAMMRHEIDLATVARCLEKIAELTDQPQVKAIALMALDGKVPNSVKVAP